MANVDTITSSEMRFILRLMKAIERVSLDCEIWPTGVIEIHSNVHDKQVGFIKVDCEEIIFCHYEPIELAEVQHDAT